MDERRPLQVANVPSSEYRPFDVDLLCAKLEAARVEREEREAASLLRKQVRDAVRKSESEDARSMKLRRKRSRPTLTIVPNNNNTTTTTTTSSSQALLSERTRSPRSPPYSRPTLSWSNVNLSIPEHRAIDSTSFNPPVHERQGTNNTIISRTASTKSDEQPQQTPTKSSPRRSPFALFKNLTTDETSTPTKRTPLKDRPDDVAKRRSITSPTLPTTTSKPDAHSMNYISEYAVCFDTSPTRHDGGMDPLDHILVSPQSLKGEGMRSFLNLPSMILKKDKKDRPRYSVEEVPTNPPPPAEAATAEAVAHPRPHTRSKTAPEGLICEAVRRIEKQQGRAKKRRSMGALLQTILLPNHHGMNASTHCVAI